MGHSALLRLLTNYILDLDGRWCDVTHRRYKEGLLETFAHHTSLGEREFLLL